MDLADYEFSKEEVQIIKGAWASDTGRLALTIIVDRLAALQGRSFVVGDQHLTSFNEGRRWIGQQLARAINAPMDKLVKETTNEPRTGRVLSATERAERAADKP